MLDWVWVLDWETFNVEEEFEREKGCEYENNQLKGIINKDGTYARRRKNCPLGLAKRRSLTEYIID